MQKKPPIHRPISRSTFILSLLFACFAGGFSEIHAEDEPLVIRSRRIDEPKPDPKPEPDSAPRVDNILIGVEYVNIVGSLGKGNVPEFIGQTGAQVVKHVPIQLAWGEMQRSKKAGYFFGRLDGYVKTYQGAGIPQTMLCLMSHSKWASKEVGKRKVIINPVPKPEAQAAYAKWIRSVVERYDGDGVSDMPGLKHPIRLVEIGAELSAQEPEPIEEYIEMLELAFGAAKQASPEVLVAHAAFLPTLAFQDDPEPGEYEAGFAAVPARITPHSLDSMRAVLNRPDLFDVINFHSMGHPMEIERIVPWLRWEMEQRGYDKPIIISDSSTSPLVAFGTPTVCNADPSEMGILFPPATEDDRCRLSSYFDELYRKNAVMLEWTYELAAADIVKRVVIAAEQGVTLINVGFIKDPVDDDPPLGRADIGIGSWAGMIDLRNKRPRPSFFALKQLTRQLRNYQKVERIAADNDEIRTYRVVTGTERELWIAWLEPSEFLLPGDAYPKFEIDLPVKASSVIVEPMSKRLGQASASRKTRMASKHGLTVHLRPTPIYVFSSF
jgi:hypothetical protein